MSDRILINYKKSQSYTRTDSNVIGATTSTTLRTITTPAAGTTNYVRKFGKAYFIEDITGDTYGATRSTAGNGWKFEFRGVTTDTLLYTIQDNAGVVTITDGSSVGTAEAVYCKLIWIQGTMNVTNGSSIALTTTGNPDAYNSITVLLPGEGVTSGAYDIDLYIAENGSTYYDSNYRHGGYRHTPLVGDERFAYLHPEDADTALGARTIVHILDSEKYQCREYSVTAGATWQAALGQTPEIFNIQGPYEYADEPATDYNNINTYFIDFLNGNDSNTGDYQNPLKTLYQAGISATKRGAAVSYRVFTTSANQVLSNSVTNIATVFPAYGNTLSISTTGTFGTGNMYNVKLSSTTVSAIGYVSYYNCEVSGSAYLTAPAAVTVTYRDSFFYNITTRGTQSGVNASRCVFDNVGESEYCFQSATGGVGVTLRNCVIKNCNQGLRIQGNNAADVRQCVFYGNTTGIYAASASGFNQNCLDNIFWNNTTDLYNDSTSIPTFDYCIYQTLDFGTTGNWTAGANTILNEDPLFIDASNNIFTTELTGPAQKVAADGYDIGLRDHCLLISGNDTEINGFILNGNNTTKSAVYAEGSYTGTALKWNTIYNYLGVATEGYGSGTVTGAVSNCNLNNNGDGVSYYNDFDNCLIYKNSKNGIYANIENTTIDFCTIYLNNNNVYFDNSGSLGIIKDSIIYNATNLEIKSDVYVVTVTYSCSTTNVDSLVDISSSTNILDDPLYISTTDGSENFRFKRKEAGYLFDSPCLGIASDGGDLGAYENNYTISSYSWRKYQLEYNPQKNEHFSMVKNAQGEDNILGDFTLYTDAQKRKFPMIFPSYATKEQRLKIQYLNSFHPSRANGLTRDDTIMRMSLLPDTLLETGESATLDYTNTWDSIDNLVKITDSNKSWVENQFRGYHLSIEFDSATDAVIDATAKTITKSGAFTGSDWTGYFIKHNDYFYYITSNTDDVLTVLDPDSTLINETKSIKVEKYFKIVSNDTQDLYIYDEDSELSGLDGAYDYVIDFIEVVVQNDDQKFMQNLYSETAENTKSQSSLFLEEA
jgi:hypothetical protein